MTMLKSSSAKQDLEPFSWVSDKIRNNPFISVVDAKTLTKSALLEAMNLNSNQENVRPLIIKNLFPTVRNDEWVTTLKSQLKNEKIEYEAKRVSDDSLEVYECKFQEYMKLIEEDRSDHEDSLYFMSEQILEKVPQLSNSLQLPINLFENNQFDLFPSCLRPNNALIIGGSGAKSFLHIDPYEWIGTNYLVKGKKLWIFISDKIPLSLFQGYGMIPDAWEMKKYRIATGYVSDVNLFQYPLSITLTEASKLSDKQLNKALHHYIRSSLPNLSHSEILDVSMIFSILRTKFNESPPLYQKYQNLPFFLANPLASVLQYEDDDEELEYERVMDNLLENTLKLLSENIYIALQEEGELITIPSGYWHQVYHLEPSIAVASQFMNSWNQERIFDHMINNAIEQSQIEDEKIQNWIQNSLETAEFDQALSSERIKHVIELVLKIQYGKELGLQHYRQIYKS